MEARGSLPPFDLNRPELWDSWADGFAYYLAFREITEEDKKKALFVSSCGAEVLDLVKDLIQPKQLAEATCQELVQALADHLTPQPSQLARRWDFRKRSQGVGESAVEFLTALRRLARSCGFERLNEVLLDQFIFGLRSEKLSSKIVRLPQCDLAKAVDFATAWERGHSGDDQQSSPRLGTNQVAGERSTSDSEGDEVLQMRQAPKGKRVRPTPAQECRREGAASCASCGEKHERRFCRFRDVSCHNCGKKGHLARVCGSRSSGRRTGGWKSVHAAELLEAEWHSLPSTSPLQVLCLPKPSGPAKIRVTVAIQGSPCEMELDTGSAVSIISAETLRRICPRGGPKLQKPRYTLIDFQRKAVPILGQGKFKVRYGKFNGKLDLLVVKGRCTSLLGLAWFEPLGIGIQGVNTTAVMDLNAICGEFPSVFDGRLGCYKGPPVSLQLDPQVCPIRLRARRVPFALKSKIEEELDRLVQQGVLEPVSHALWETPIVAPVKANGDVRICGDYKCTINKALQDHAYPVPVVSHVLATLAGAKVFGKLDLAQAYQQLPVDNCTAEAQTIVTHKGAFRVKRLQFGVSVAPGLFQNLMDSLLKGLPGVTPFFDDVLIAAPSKEEFVDRLRSVLRRFETAGLKVKREKCLLGVDRVEFLGFSIDAAGIHPSKDKEKAILDAPTPKNKQELQAFLGLLNFYHAFLPHKAAVAEPLHRLLKKNVPWAWGPRQASAFQAVKGLLVSNSVLAHFNEKLPVVLACDASSYGIGAVLGHLLPNGKEVPVAYYSRTLSPAERNYAQIDKEGLAIVAGVKKFHDYLYGRPFTILTDHKPLLGLFAPDRQTPHVLSPRVLRWSIFLAGYQYALQHRSGKAMGHADALSRLPLSEIGPDPAPAHQIMLIEELPERPLHAADVAKRTARDPVLSRVLDWVGRGWPKVQNGQDFKPFVSRKDELSTHKGCLLWGSRVVIPKPLRRQVLVALHEAHPGIVRMKALARSYVWWPGLDAEIEAWVKRCRACQESRPDPPQGPVQSWEPTRSPWSRLHLDFAGPFQGQIFLILVDSYTKWLEVVRVSSTTASVVVRALRSIFATHGIPDVVVTDNGTAFTSREFREFVESNLIRHVRSAPFHPATNGQAERMVRTTKEALRRIGPMEWERKLACFLLSYRTTPNPGSGYSPAELLMGRRLTTRLDRLHPDRVLERRFQTEVHEAPRGFFCGDPVWARNYSGNPVWLAATVLRVTGPVSYEVAVEDGRILKRHIEQLRSRLPGDSMARPRHSSSEETVTGGTSPLEEEEELEDFVEPAGSVGPNTSRSAEMGATAVAPLPQSPSQPQAAVAPPTVETPEETEPRRELRRSQRERRPPSYFRDYVSCDHLDQGGRGVVSWDQSCCALPGFRSNLVEATAAVTDNFPPFN